MKHSDYPYLDKTTKQLPGEIWKDIPGFEEYYQASTFGRIRSVDRVVPHPRLHQQKVNGRILSQSVSKNVNTVSEKKMVDLRVSLGKEGKSYYYNTRRLVYQTFIGEVDYHKDGLNIIHKDCDGYNCRADNLDAVTVTQKTRRAFKRGRVPESYLKTADRSKWTKPFGGASVAKPIRQLDINGNLIRKFNSVKEASRITGIGEKEIINVAKGRYASWNGMKYEYI